MAQDPQNRDRMPFLHLLPNLVTIAGMCLGLTSIRYAMAERFETAALLILLSALIDGLDGLIARRLHATSDFGAELDSLSDFLCFGVAPGVLVYQFALSGTDSLGWIFVLVFAASTCLRLARFNVMRGDETGGTRHFIGVPAPAGAMLGLFPVFVSLANLVDLRELPVLTAFWLGVVGLLMISRIKTFSPKTLRVPRPMVGILLMATVIGIGLIFSRIWLLLALVDLIYVVFLLPEILRRRGRLFA